jgi:hypothetical protein
VRARQNSGIGRNRRELCGSQSFSNKSSWLMETVADLRGGAGGDRPQSKKNFRFLSAEKAEK